MRIERARLGFLAALLFAAVGTNAVADDRVFDLAVRETAGEQPPVLSVREGDTVVIRLTADEPLRVHLHGYDIEREVEPSRIASMRVEATATGRFALEIHSHVRRKRPLAYLEVRPR